MAAIICLFLAFIMLMYMAVELLLLIVVLVICGFLLLTAWWFLSFWFKFMLLLTWPYGMIVLIGVVLVIWLIRKIR